MQLNTATVASKLSHWMLSAQTGECARNAKTPRMSRIRERVPVTPTEQCCSRCGLVKPAAAFYKARWNASGITGVCKECRRNEYATKIKPVTSQEKTCRKCQRTLPGTEFYPHKHTGDGLSSLCKDCSKRSVKLVKYGKDAERLLDLDTCEICGLKMSVGMHIDHNHSTGEVRGVLCPGCNSGLGHFRESIPSLRSAINYLLKYNSAHLKESA